MNAVLAAGLRAIFPFFPRAATVDFFDVFGVLVFATFGTFEVFGAFAILVALGALVAFVELDLDDFDDELRLLAPFDEIKLSPPASRLNGNNNAIVNKNNIALRMVKFSLRVRSWRDYL